MDKNADDFGYSSALFAALSMFEHGARTSGRSISMMERAKNGDTIVFAKHQEAERIKHLLRNDGIEVWAVECRPSLRALHDRLLGTRGRVLFDHGWLYEYYQQTIEAASEALAEVKAFHVLTPGPERAVFSQFPPSDPI